MRAGGDRSLAAPSGLAAEFAQLNQMLAQVNSLLKTAGPQLKAATHFYGSYTAETGAIAQLTAKLAAQNNAAAQARTQQQITKAQDIQNNAATVDTTDCGVASTDLDEASTLESSVQSSLDSLPSPAIVLSGAITTVPATTVPGKKATVAILVSNSGNVTAGGSLAIGLAFRPVGISGSADVTLKPTKARIRVPAGSSSSEQIAVVAPKTLPAGSYSLVAQLDPNNAFREASIPSPAVTTTPITVS